MILPKLFRYLLLSCLISIVFTQTESLPSTAIETNVTETNAPTTTTTSTSTNTESLTSLIEPTTTSISTNSTNPTNNTSIIPPTTTNNNADLFPTVQTPGWNSNGNNDDSNQQSWLRQHNRFVFVIFLGLIFLSILIWYIVRSVKGMRKRLEEENQAQLYMMQQARSPPPQQQRNDRIIPELTQSPPPVYKTEDHSLPVQTVNNNGQSNY